MDASINHSDWRRVDSKSVPPYLVFTKPLQKPEKDDREYRIIQLDNGLQATLVHDKTADKAAASLDVTVGHLFDPIDMPGLAHFCEHLLFMGTEQFPRENEYSEFLAKNNGGSNAYTSTSNTNYYFNVGTHALGDALQRFAAFFHSPLFAPSCTARELNAIDSEHQKNHQSDMWRIFQLNKHLSIEGHVWTKFGSGNKTSLSRAAKEVLAQQGEPSSDALSLAPSPVSPRIPPPVLSVSASGEVEADGGPVGRETRRRLVEWWAKEYCASRMRLSVIGQESLDQLAELSSVLFSPIPNRGQNPLPMFSDHPFGPNEKGTMVYAKTIMSFHAMEISFPLEYQPPFWSYKPANFISHFVGHEGPGSLYSYLRDKGLVTNLSSGQQCLARGLSMFKVTVHLTEEGFQRYREIILAVFQYFALLNSSTFDKYHQEEIANVSQIRFRFKEKRRPDQYAIGLSENMSLPIPPELLLSAPFVTWNRDSKFGLTKVKQYLDSFRLTEGRVVLMATGVDQAKVVSSNAIWEREPWYGTEYFVERFDNHFLKQAAALNSNPQLYLPKQNKFIPSNFNVEKISVAEPLKRPQLLKKSPFSVLWHKKDDRFFVPKAQVVIDLRSPVGNETPRAAVLTKLYSDIVNDALSEYTYDADLAGLAYKFIEHSNGLYVSMNGYNDKMALLVRHVLEKIKSLNVKPERLAVMKEQTRRNWQNFFLGQSYTLSDYYTRYIMSEKQYTLEEKLAEIDSVTPTEIQEHIQKLLCQTHLRMLVAGNIFKDEAIRIGVMAEEGLGICPLPSLELNDRALLLPKSCNYVWTSAIQNPDQANSALSYYVHFGPVTDQRLRVTAALLTQILSEPTFNVLRTQEQLGYVVSCTSWTLAGDSQRGLRIVVQSEKTPQYLERRVEAFLEGMKSYIEKINSEVFSEQMRGLQKKWLEADKNLTEESFRFAAQVSNGHWDFMRHENDAEFIKTVTKEHVLALFMSHVHPSSSTRSKLSIHMVSQKLRPKRVSADASKAFEALVENAKLEIDKTAWIQSLGQDSTPLVMDFSNYWKQVLDSKDGDIAGLLNAIPELVEKYPVDGEGEDLPLPGAIYISDLREFRSSLESVLDPGPMVEWGDLPYARM